MGALHWAGTLLSFLGIYIVVGRGAHVSDASLRGDADAAGGGRLLGALHDRRAPADGAPFAGRSHRAVDAASAR